jgi:AcrR family transcriptional regulator
MAKPIERPKNRAQTEQHILSTVEQILEKDGGAAVNISRIVKEAGVARTLIYRYFGSVEGLLLAYANSKEFWPTVDEVIGMTREEYKQHNLMDKIRILTVGYAEEVGRRPHTLAILAWSLMESNPITELLDQRRSDLGQEVRKLLVENEDFSKLDPDFDIEAVLVVLHAAMAYLGMRKRAHSTISNIDLTDEESNERIDKTFEYILNSIEFYMTRDSTGKTKKKRA